MVSTFEQPDFTDQEPTAYKTALDGAIAVLARPAGAFAPHEEAVPGMTVRLDAGAIPATGALPAEVAAQSTATIAAPSSDPRHDIVYIDRLTGAVGVATGTEDPSPADPAVPAGKVAVARVRLTAAQAEIVNADIDDLRVLSVLGLGSAAFEAATAFDPAGTAAAAVGGLGDLAVEDDAAGVPYDPTASGLAATDVQAAVDELAAAPVIVAGTPLVINPFAINTAATQAHGLGAVPSFLDYEFECLTGEHNWTAGDRVKVNQFIGATLGGNIWCQVDATNVSAKVANATFAVVNKTSFAAHNMTPGNWKLTITPYLVA